MRSLRKYISTAALPRCSCRFPAAQQVDVGAPYLWIHRTHSSTIHHPPDTPTSGDPQRSGRNSTKTMTTNAVGQKEVQDTLLQFNIMVDQGIEPDAAMYTHIIKTMADAGHEWQAYKFFSRMLEQGLEPLPETFLALREATGSQRGALSNDIALKAQETLESQPMQKLEKAIEHERNEALMERAAVRRLLETTPESMLADVDGDDAEDDDFVDIFASEEGEAESGKKNREATEANGPSQEGTNGEAETHASAGADNDEAEFRSSSIPTMHITSPRAVWETLRHMEELRKVREQPKATGSARQQLRETLRTTLHEEELNIFLAANRQLRHGNKDDRIDRILDNVPQSRIEEMLRRRKRYFRGVSTLLEAHMAELASDGVDWEQVRADIKSSKVATDEARSDKDKSVDEKLKSNAMRHEDPNSGETAEDGQGNQSAVSKNIEDDDQLMMLQMRSVMNKESTTGEQQFAVMQRAVDPTTKAPAAALIPVLLTEEEKSRNMHVMEAQRQWVEGPDEIHTPWGSLQKPKTASLETATSWRPRNLSHRKMKQHFTEEERAHLLDKLTGVGNNSEQALSSVALKDLEKYLKQFDLSFDRSVDTPEEVMEKVRWHLTQYPPFSPSVGPTPIAPSDADIEREGMRRTMDSFEALHIIAKNCDNMSLVDSAETSRQILRTIKQRRVAVQRQAEMSRRERHLAADVAAREAERTYRGNPAIDGGDRFRKQQLQSNANECEEPQKRGRLLGLREEHLSVSDSTELPPWELRPDEDGFNLRTGEMSRDVPQIIERHSGKFTVLAPSREKEEVESKKATKKFHFSFDLLSKADQEMMLGIVESEQQLSAIEQEHAEREERRQQSKRFRRVSEFIAKANEKKKAEKEKARLDSGAPLGSALHRKMRMSEILRAQFDTTRHADQTLSSLKQYGARVSGKAVWKDSP